MRKLVVTTFLSLDGIMQAPGGAEEDESGSFDLGGWTVNFWDEMMGQAMDEFLAPGFDSLLGRKTYEIFAAHWPYSKDPGADVFNNATKYVASNTLKEVTWKNSILLEGDLVDTVIKLKEQDGPNIYVAGSSDLIQSLLKNDLIDQFNIWVFPVVLGKGKRLFGKGTIPKKFELMNVKTSTTGVIIADYEKSGEIELGSFALEDEPQDQTQPN